jgi:hypothetical protein
MTRRLSTRTFVYALIVVFIALTLLALVFGLPAGGTSGTEAHLPRL